jgi:hypothetical protein
MHSVGNNIFLQSVLDVLTSRKSVAYLIFLWFVLVFGSVFYLAPGDDDFFFISQTLSVVHKNTIGIYDVDRIIPAFLNLPGLVFFQGAFFKAFGLIGVSVNIYTYRLFICLVVFGLVCAGAAFLYSEGTQQHNEQTASFRANVFLVLLGVTPFVMDGLNIRPEAPGLLCLVLGILLLSGTTIDTPPGPVKSFAAGVCIGTSFTMHPTIIFGAGIAATLLIARLVVAHQWKVAGLGALGALVPIGWMATWYGVHAPLSTDILFFAASHRGELIGEPAIKMFLQAGRVFSEGINAVSVYYSILYSVLIGVLLVGIIMCLTNIRKILARDATLSLLFVFAFFIGNIVLLLVTFGGRAQIYTVVSFSFILFLAATSGPVQIPRQEKTG